MSQNISYQGYEKFKQSSNILVNLIQRHMDILKVLNKPEQKAKLEFLKDLVQSITFKVMVIGEFKRGKSTFINALLGEEVLPACSTPCTAIITEVKWSETKSALLHFKKVDDQSLKQPISVQINEIEEYVVIKDDNDQSKAINESPYEKLELFWPLKLCDNGVEIIDSPGLNEHKTRQQITESYLTSTDAILFVLSCEQLFSKSEQEIVNNKFIPMGHKDIFFICNRINMIRKDEVDRVKTYAISKLSDLTRLGAERIFFLNALGALDAKTEGDTGIIELEKSGIVELEAELQNFLTNDRGRVKILRHSQVLKNSIREIKKTIPEQRSMLQTDIIVLEKRYTKAQESLLILEIRRKDIVKKTDILIENAKEEITNKTKKFCHYLVLKIKTIIQEYQLKSEIKLLFADPRLSIEAAIKEVLSYLESQVESEFADWQRSELEPLMAKQIENIKNSLDAEAIEFLQRIDNLRLQISGISVSTVEVLKTDVGVRDISAVERIFSAAGGFLIGGVGADIIGASFGYQEMLKGLIPQIAIGIIGYIILGINPVTLVPIIVATLIQGKFIERSLGNKIKEEVNNKFSEHLVSSTIDIVKKVSDTVSSDWGKFKSNIDRGLNAEIQNIVNQVNTIITDKKKGQAEVNKKLKQLDKLAQDIDSIDQELDNLINEFDISRVSK